MPGETIHTKDVEAAIERELSPYLHLTELLHNHFRFHFLQNREKINFLVPNQNALKSSILTALLDFRSQHYEALDIESRPPGKYLNKYRSDIEDLLPAIVRNIPTVTRFLSAYLNDFIPKWFHDHGLTMPPSPQSQQPQQPQQPLVMTINGQSAPQIPPPSAAI